MRVVCSVIGMWMVGESMSGIVTGVCVGLSMEWGCLCNWYVCIGDVMCVRDRHTPIAHPMGPCARHPKDTQTHPRPDPTRPTPTEHPTPHMYFRSTPRHTPVTSMHMCGGRVE